MTISIIGSVLVGVLVGFLFVPETLIPYIDNATVIALNILLFLVGIEIGMNKHVFKDIKKHGLLLILVPALIVLGSLFGGLITGYIFEIPYNISLSIASGFGWYSLSGIMLTNLHSAEIGTIAFLSNVIRELITIISIPIIAKYLNDYATIAPAGATSMDTTLPIISKYTNSEIVIIAFFNGSLLSTLVPILVPFFYMLG